MNSERKTKKATRITCLFVDIGGVLLTNGWDHPARKRAAKHFGLDLAEIEELHHITFDTYEEGDLRLDEYLKRVVFHSRRSFTNAEFKKFMFEQSKAFSKMLDLIPVLKQKYGLKIFAVSNEARELNEYRIREFKLNSFIDSFISSCYVHIRKPDVAIFKMALDVAQVPPAQIVYIENTQMFVTIAESLGIRGILHKSYAETAAALKSLGLTP